MGELRDSPLWSGVATTELAGSAVPLLLLRFVERDAVGIVVDIATGDGVEAKR